MYDVKEKHHQHSPKARVNTNHSHMEKIKDFPRLTATEHQHAEAAN